MATFSQLVDSMAQETRRPDLILDVSTYLNQTLREVHFRPDTNAAILYAENLREDQLTADRDNGFIWSQPDPRIFQTLAAVRYDTICVSDDKARWVPERTPGLGMSGLQRVYYRTGPGYAFMGYGGVGGKISIAWFEYPRRLQYFRPPDRPATQGEDGEWLYHPDYDVDEETRLIARQKVSNWLLNRWEDVIGEGVRAKVYKRVSDTERGRTAYSSFGALRGGLVTSESVTVGAFG